MNLGPERLVARVPDGTLEAILSVRSAYLWAAVRKCFRRSGRACPGSVTRNASGVSGRVPREWLVNDPNAIKHGAFPIADRRDTRLPTVFRTPGAVAHQDVTDADTPRAAS